MCLGNDPRWPHRAFGLWSPGTNKNDDGLFYWEYNLMLDPVPAGFIKSATDAVYDPSNGTVSGGDYMRMGGNVRGMKNLPGKIDGA